MEGEIAVFIPIIMFLVIGLILVTFIFYRSKERQMLINKGLSAEEIKQFFHMKRDPFFLLKFGIICFFFGIGLGIGLILNDTTSKEYWVPLFLFTISGLGFVISNLVGNKLAKQNNPEQRSY
jgi:Na+/melibiose symporter-like transporter